MNFIFVKYLFYENNIHIYFLGVLIADAVPHALVTVV